MKIVIAPDSFKGSLSAREASSAIVEGVRSILPKAEIEEIPVADGGEGTMDSLVLSTHGQFVETSALDPLGREINTKYGILGDGNTAVIEMSVISGLTLLKNNELNPLLTTTYGTGQLIQHALDCGLRKFIICIGGSATNDCGTGMAQSLGIQFINKNNIDISERMCGGKLNGVADFDSSNIHPGINDSQFLVASDVNNPLLGPHGCAKTYAPQKGATPEIVEILERNMKTFINIAEEKSGKSVRDIEGSGAAGGLGAGLMLFLNGRLLSGIDIVLDACDFQNRIKNADLIITGEGKIDNQTIHGKTIFGVAQQARQQHIPTVAFAGIVEDNDTLKCLGISDYYQISSKDMSIEESVKNASILLQNKVKNVMRTLCKQSC